jgi:hypothetical protein
LEEQDSRHLEPVNPDNHRLEEQVNHRLQEQDSRHLELDNHQLIVHRVRLNKAQDRRW